MRDQQQMFEDSNRIADAIGATRKKLEDQLRDEGGTEFNAKLDTLEPKLDLGTDEWIAWQNARADAQAGGKLNLEESTTLYTVIGQTAASRDTDGWPVGTDIATKIAVTSIMRLVLGGKL